MPNSEEPPSKRGRTIRDQYGDEPEPLRSTSISQITMPVLVVVGLVGIIIGYAISWGRGDATTTIKLNQMQDTQLVQGKTLSEINEKVSGMHETNSLLEQRINTLERRITDMETQFYVNFPNARPAPRH